MPVVYRPHPVYWHNNYAHAIAHAQAQCWKGLSSHKKALLQSMEGTEYCTTVVTEHAGYVLYGALVIVCICHL